MALTAKQELFVREYLVDSNATQAAIRAGYSKDTARAIGAENLTKPYIMERIDHLTNERFKRLDITADDIMQEYKKMGFADIKNYLSYRTALTKVGSVDDEDVFDYAQVIDMKDSDDVDGAAISQVSISKDGTFKFKLHDKKGSLDSLARIKGMFQDKVEHSGEMTLTFEDKLRDIVK